jgi:hypothetical protein
MMAALVLRCLGALEVALDATVVTAFPTDKVRALLTYLALEPDQHHRREELARLLWSEMPQAAAQNNLRVVLHRLRETLDKTQPGAGAMLLASTRQTVQLHPAALQVDVTTFQALLAACSAHAHGDLSTCEECLVRLTQAVALYRGELLAGISLADAPAFEEWLLLRHTLHGHTEEVHDLVFDETGTLLVSTGHDRTIRLWDPQSGELLYTLSTWDTTLLSIAFHPQADWLALGGNDHVSRLWDIQNERLLATFYGHTNRVEAVRFSPDGQWLASADETIRLWDVTTGDCRQILRVDGPYAGMNIASVTGISAAQKAALKALGAVETN